ncbi:hypothetical protein CYMTET_55701 [Cymbomonas tetramitiformis]|uniref:Heparan-alpha-glucosaminide N-acetyltransferase catalytic domain-containing protein n=1 Tax=Cymbomonas tetramitiformis TaxID=36881 RepID=A0AAE0BEB0_9CHLO|nr:hypothetical protein CYMTET_55701 [Cymbomonas tetramitiformis]
MATTSWSLAGSGATIADADDNVYVPIADNLGAAASDGSQQDSENLMRAPFSPGPPSAPGGATIPLSYASPSRPETNTRNAPASPYYGNVQWIDGPPATGFLNNEVRMMNEQPVPRSRVATVDAIRGLSVAVMILVDDTGGKFASINHCAWNGLHLADFVMPFFLFITGTTGAVVLPGRIRNDGRLETTKSVVMRSLRLFALGVFIQGGFLHGYQEHTYGVDLSAMRLPGILQRIAFTYLVAGVCEIWLPINQSVNTSLPRPIRTLIRFGWHWAVALVLTSIYLAIIFGVRVPDWSFNLTDDHEQGDRHFKVTCGVRGHLTPACNAAGYLDRAFFGPNHMYQHPEYQRLPECTDASPYSGELRADAPNWCLPVGGTDPEGLLGALTACLCTLIGAHFGHVLKTSDNHVHRVRQWAACSLSLLAAGLLLHLTQAGPSLTPCPACPRIPHPVWVLTPAVMVHCAMMALEGLCAVQMRGLARCRCGGLRGADAGAGAVQMQGAGAVQIRGLRGLQMREPCARADHRGAGAGPDRRGLLRQAGHGACGGADLERKLRSADAGGCASADLTGALRAMQIRLARCRSAGAGARVITPRLSASADARAAAVQISAELTTVTIQIAISLRSADARGSASAGLRGLAWRRSQSCAVQITQGAGAARRCGARGADAGLCCGDADHELAAQMRGAAPPRDAGGLRAAQMRGLRAQMRGWRDAGALRGADAGACAAMPHNKQLFSVSYVFSTSAAAGFVFCAFYILADWHGHYVFLNPFIWMGRNAIIVFVFAASGVFDIFLATPYWHHPDENIVDHAREDIFDNLFGEKDGLMVMTLTKIVFWFMVAGLLNHNKWYWTI